MSPAIQLIIFNYNDTEESAVIHGTIIVKYDPNKYCHCFRGTENENWTPKIDKQLNGGNK